MSVAVVILNWNGKEFMQKFLPPLIERTKHQDRKYTIIVADNGSNDGSVEWLKETYSEDIVKTILFDQNYGFTGGYNKAFDTIKSSEGEYKYYLLLNSDVEVSEAWLDPLYELMEADYKIGICSPKVLSYHNREYFEHAGACGGLIDRFGFPYCRGRVLSTIEKDKGQYDQASEIFWASGTSFMIRSELWHRLGGLDNIFFAHMEEIDMCWRAKLLGYQVWVEPKSKIYHVGGGTLPNNSPRKLYLNFRNNLLMLHKNLPARGRSYKIFLRQCIDGCIGIVYLLTGKWSFFKSVIKAHNDFRKLRKEAIISEKIYPVTFSKATLIGLKIKSLFH